jgi:predicted CXXCH cytochrome family protein
MYQALVDSKTKGGAKVTKRRASRLFLMASVMVLVVLLASSAISAQTKSFTDVKGHWAEADIISAATAGIINGYPDGTFKPEAQVIQQHFGFMLANAGKSVKVDNDSAVTTRELAAKFLVLGFGFANEAIDADATLAKFADKDKIAAENKKFVAIAVKKGFLTGFDAATFAPQATLTRAQAAAVILRATKQVAAAPAPAPAPKPVVNEYVGSATCQGCHFDKYQEWKETFHAKMIRDAKEDGSVVADLSTLPADGKAIWDGVRYAVGGNYDSQRFLVKGADGLHTYFSYEWDVKKGLWRPSGVKGRVWETSCARCHTVGFKPETKKFAEKGIGCESCHGPGQDHILSRGDRTKIVKDLSNASCGSCHGQAKEMETTGHAKALESLKAPQYAAYAAKAGYCVNCHSAETIVAPVGQKPAFDQLKVGVTCVACHDPHNKVEAKQLRTSVEQSCVTCHDSGYKGGTFTAGKPARNPQREVLRGVGAIGVSETPNYHYRNNVSCSTCHMTPTGYMNLASHEFKVITPKAAIEKKLKNDSCTYCHTTSDRDFRQGYLDFWQGNVSKKVAELQPRIDAAAAKVKADPNLAPEVKALYDAAYTNFSLVNYDGSKGAHNYEYIMKVLSAVDKNVKEFEDKTK